MKRWSKKKESKSYFFIIGSMLTGGITDLQAKQKKSSHSLLINYYPVSEVSANIIAYIFINAVIAGVLYI